MCFQTSIENSHELFIFPVSKACLDKRKNKTKKIDFLNLLWGIQVKSKRGQIAAK